MIQFRSFPSPFAKKQNPFFTGFNLNSVFKNMNSRLDKTLKRLDSIYSHHEKSLNQFYSNKIFDQIANGINPRKVI
jgi:hypothetical protein